jgi:hypothetical protein
MQVAVLALKQHRQQSKMLAQCVHASQWQMKCTVLNAFKEYSEYRKEKRAVILESQEILSVKAAFRAFRIAVKKR